MNGFMQQMKEDIEILQRDYGYIDDNLKREEFAFNYWILNRLYNLDEEIIPSYVTDIHDKGIDCFVHYEDMKELYIIQNKFYDENTYINREEAADFLTTPLSVLLAGNYKRSQELQRIFDCIHTDPEYKIWLHFYVSNDLENKEVDNLFKQFSFSDERVKGFVGVKLYKLSDIKNIYFGERFTNKTTFTAKLTTRVSGTSLDVRPREYELDWMIDLRFVMVNVADLYMLYKEALKHNYELFEENVREYLGTQGINNGIIKTLQSPEDRENFFYYNNGITMMCEKCETLRGTEAAGNNGIRSQYGFKLRNPQIVNGCQTINSIAEVLSHCNENKIHEEFAKAFVLVKVYVFDDKTKQEKEGLDENIVKYTNSQNGIDGKAFAAKHNYFKNIQDEFRSRGLLLLVKPSDKNKFTVQYSDKSEFAELKRRAKDLLDLFDVDDNKLKNYMIPLEKLLKVCMAFDKGGYYAFTKGSSVLKTKSVYYKDFSLNIDQLFTIDNMLKIYLLFGKAEEEKKLGDKRNPIPYYMLGFLGKEFKGLDGVEKNEKLKIMFSNKGTLNKIYDFYKNLTPFYADEYFSKREVEYNKMIKQEIDDEILEKCKTQMLRFAAADEVKKFVKNIASSRRP